MVVELVGPPGSGKTTLARVLAETDPAARVSPPLRLRGARDVPSFVRAAVPLLPTLARPGWQWEQIKGLAYASHWHRLLARRDAGKDGALLLDHGPVFWMATLYGFGPEAVRGPASENWWERTLARWAETLDLIVWLDAPDALLIERIETRDQRHSVRGRGESAAREHIATYRRAFRHVFSRLAQAGGPEVLCFQTDAQPTQDISLALSARWGHRHPSEAREPSDGHVWD